MLSVHRNLEDLKDLTEKRLKETNEIIMRSSFAKEPEYMPDEYDLKEALS